MKSSRRSLLLLVLFMVLLCASITACKKEPPPPPPKNTLSVESGVIFKSGEVVPLARINLQLVKKDFGDIIKDVDIVRSPDRNRTYESSPLIPFITILVFKDEIMTDKASESYAAYLKALDEQAVASVTTGFDGKAVFPDVPQGTFFLVAYTKIRKQVAVWNVKVDIKQGANSIVLDQNNATIFP